MPRYRLRTLLIVLALGPPVLAGAWWLCRIVRPVDWLILLVYGVLPQLVWLTLTEGRRVVRWLSGSRENR